MHNDYTAPRQSPARMPDGKPGKTDPAQPVPNDKLNGFAKREEALLLHLVLTCPGVMAKCAAAGLTAGHFFNDVARRLYAMAASRNEQAGAMLSRPMLETCLTEDTPEEAAKLRSQYDGIVTEFGVNEKDAGAYIARAIERHAQAVSYWQAVKFADDLLHATRGQAEIIERHAANVAVVKARPESQSGPQFDHLTLSQLDAYEPNPADAIAGDGWIRRGNMMLMTGPTGVGKSVLAEQLCCSMASGAPFLGIPVSRPCRVLHVQAENDADTLQRDILSIVRNAPGMDRDRIDGNLTIINAFGLSGDTLAAWLSREVEEHKPDLVVMDNYGAYVGAGNLNDSSTLLAFRGAIEPLMKTHGFALVLLTHTNKPSKDRQEWAARESVYQATGASGISNWARTSCELSQNGEDGKYRLRFGKNCERNGLEDDEGRLVRDLYIEHSGNRHQPYWRVCEFQKKITPEDAKAATIAVLKADNPQMSVRDLAAASGFSRTTVSRLLKKVTVPSDSAVPCPVPPLRVWDSGTVGHSESVPRSKLSRGTAWDSGTVGGTVIGTASSEAIPSPIPSTETMSACVIEVSPAGQPVANSQGDREDTHDDEH